MRHALRFVGHTLGRHSLASALATSTDFALASTLHALGASPGAATFLGCVAGGGVAFGLGRHFSFRAAEARALPQLARFLFVWATSALLNSSGVSGLLPLVGSFSLAWLLVRGAVFIGWNYPLSRWYVFAVRKRDLAGHGPPARDPAVGDGAREKPAKPAPITLGAP
jgi:putative flippase GtrA